jgi:hypothetical protein
MPGRRRLQSLSYILEGIAFSAVTPKSQSRKDSPWKWSWLSTSPFQQRIVQVIGRDGTERVTPEPS